MEEFGGYYLGEQIGSGGMGRVYRALDADGRNVAVKILHPAISADPKARARLAREVATLHRVRGAGVARVLDAEVDDTEAFVVTELIDGPTLQDDVENWGAFTMDELAGLASGLKRALEQIHAAGVVHRDLKPSNVMMDSTGPVLIDFGIAQVADDARFTATGLVTGTAGYLDPEALLGKDPSPAGDWWSWAAVLCFAGTGRAPYGSGPTPGIIARVHSEEVDTAGLPEAVADVLRRALAVSPLDRPSPATVLATIYAAAEAGDDGSIAEAENTRQVLVTEHLAAAREQVAAGDNGADPRFAPGAVGAAGAGAAGAVGAAGAASAAGAAGTAAGAGIIPPPPPSVGASPGGLGGPSPMTGAADAVTQQVPALGSDGGAGVAGRASGTGGSGVAGGATEQLGVHEGYDSGGDMGGAGPQRESIFAANREPATRVLPAGGGHDATRAYPAAPGYGGELDSLGPAELGPPGADGQLPMGPRPLSAPHPWTSIAALIGLSGLSLRWPGWVLVGVLIWMFITGIFGQGMRAHAYSVWRYGRRASDGVMIAGRALWHTVAHAFAALWHVVIAVIILSIAYLLGTSSIADVGSGWASAGTDPVASAIAMAVVMTALWWQPSYAAGREATRRAISLAFPGFYWRALLALALIGLAGILLMVTLGTPTTANWAPLSSIDSWLQNRFFG